MEIRTIGIDLGKTVFHLVGVNAQGEVEVRRKCSRLQLLVPIKTDDRLELYSPRPLRERWVVHRAAVRARVLVVSP
jgi:hypothetical protein